MRTRIAAVCISACLGLSLLPALGCEGADAGNADTEELGYPDMTEAAQPDSTSSPDEASSPEAGIPDADPPLDIMAEIAPPAPASVAPKLALFLEGRFDSTGQAAENFAYFEVQLCACRVQAPKLGEYVLYVEQAMMSALGQPYRQRIYVVEALEPAEVAAVSRVFSLKDPGQFTGLCETGLEKAVTPSMVEERKGCEVLVEWQDGAFLGGTAGQNCASSLNGAQYATSQVEITKNRITSWDQGFNAQGVQVWGAEAGPYVFDRKTAIR